MAPLFRSAPPECTPDRRGRPCEALNGTRLRAASRLLVTRSRSPRGTGSCGTPSAVMDIATDLIFHVSFVTRPTMTGQDEDSPDLPQLETASVPDGVDRRAF